MRKVCISGLILLVLAIIMEFPLLGQNEETQPATPPVTTEATAADVSVAVEALNIPDGQKTVVQNQLLDALDIFLLTPEEALLLLDSIAVALQAGDITVADPAKIILSTIELTTAGLPLQQVNDLVGAALGLPQAPAATVDDVSSVISVLNIPVADKTEVRERLQKALDGQALNPEGALAILLEVVGALAKRSVLPKDADKVIRTAIEFVEAGLPPQAANDLIGVALELNANPGQLRKLVSALEELRSSGFTLQEANDIIRAALENNFDPDAIDDELSSALRELVKTGVSATEAADFVQGLLNKKLNGKDVETLADAVEELLKEGLTLQEAIDFVNDGLNDGLVAKEIEDRAKGKDSSGSGNSEDDNDDDEDNSGSGNRNSNDDSDSNSVRSNSGSGNSDDEDGSNSNSGSSNSGSGNSNDDDDDKDEDD